MYTIPYSAKTIILPVFSLKPYKVCCFLATVTHSSTLHPVDLYWYHGIHSRTNKSYLHFLSGKTGRFVKH